MRVFQICKQFQPVALEEGNQIHQPFAVKVLVSFSSNPAQKLSVLTRSGNKHFVNLTVRYIRSFGKDFHKDIKIFKLTQHN